MNEATERPPIDLRLIWLLFAVGVLVMILSGSPGYAQAGKLTRFQGPTECSNKTNTSLWVYQQSADPPRVNSWFVLRGHRSTTPLKTDKLITAAWAIGVQKHEPPFSTALAPGCLLLVQPLFFMICVDKEPAAPLPPGRRMGAWREGPFAYLLLNPQPDLLGLSLFVQLVCIAPGANTMGVLASSGIKLKIGA